MILIQGYCCMGIRIYFWIQIFSWQKCVELKLQIYRNKYELLYRYLISIGTRKGFDPLSRQSNS
jgi:hypothetical protein